MNASLARARRLARLPHWLTPLACAALAACAGLQPQAPAATMPPPPGAPNALPAGAEQLASLDPRERVEPNVKRTVIEDRGSKIEELRVRGQAQRIVVTPKVGTTKTYEIITDSSSREMYDGSGASRGAVGKRVWNVFTF